MTYDELIAPARAALRSAIAERDANQETLMKMRSDVAEGKEVCAEDIPAAIAARDEASAKVERCERDLQTLLDEQAEDARIADLREQTVDVQPSRRAYDQVARVGREERTYRPDHDPKGKGFLRDFLASEVNKDFAASQRLSRHMDEERVEREKYLARAADSSAFSGLIVPQYLTELYAPRARAARPFANACRPHDLPAEGNTVSISRITTGTDTGIRTSETTDVAEQDIDDTLLTVPVQENAGSQSLTRRAVMRGQGTEAVTLEDLFAAYATKLDATLLNQSSGTQYGAPVAGLSAAATAITYTSASPTAAELYPKVIGGMSAVEAALINQDPNGTAAVMHSRRWYWMQSQLSSTFPLIAQPFGLGFNAGGVNNANGYGDSVRGVLPNGTPVIVDNNVASNLGAGTNQDEVYIVSLPECHLWEDGEAPMMIRTDTGPNMKKNMIDIVVFGFFAYTFGRQPHAQKLAGTGLISPTF